MKDRRFNDVATGRNGMRHPSIPAHYKFFGECVEYGSDGKPTGWMRAAWYDPGGDFMRTGTADLTLLSGKVDATSLPHRNSNGSLARANEGNPPVSLIGRK